MSKECLKKLFSDLGKAILNKIPNYSKICNFSIDLVVSVKANKI